jgi:exodeoxyribonuclease VII small subunit
MTAKEPPKSFEASMERLEAIVADLESGEFSLEESLKKFEEGFTLGKHCREILDKAQVRVEKLAGPENGGGQRDGGDD